MLKGARKDKPTVTGDGTPLRTLLAGVEVREVRNIVTRNGLTTEVYRSDWHAGAAPVAQTLYVSLRPGAVMRVAPAVYGKATTPSVLPT